MALPKRKKVCKYCLMIRFMLLFLAIVAVFLLNGVYQFWN